MTEQEFLQVIYSGIKPGMDVQKPNKLSRILDVTQAGNIYYLIGEQNKKAVTKKDLREVYRHLSDGNLTNRKISEISGSSRPCNNSTVKWILSRFNLAEKDAKGNWHPTAKIQ